jgi:hypothetical protein
VRTIVLAMLLGCGAEVDIEPSPQTICDDGNPCTLDERGATGCTNVVRPDYDPCILADEPGVCAGGVCVPRAGCDAQETKCQSPTVPIGWCGTWQWPASDVLYCQSCENLTCLGVPGCSPVGDVCQGGDGEGGCPPGCCPICY